MVSNILYFTESNHDVQTTQVMSKEEVIHKLFKEPLKDFRMAFLKAP